MGMPESTLKEIIGSLPILGFMDEIIQTIKDNQVTIVVAETGAGKSTQVPQALLRNGYEVVVTQPRRLAARTVAERVASEYGCRLGDVVGFQTANDSQKSSRTRCLFVTDGLAMIRELLGRRKPGTILVIDEVHEWNINIEVLVGYVKHLIKNDKEIKVVLMSATLEAEALSNHFDGAPIINVPGKLFPIEERAPRGDIVADTIALLREGRNVLVFQPGKREIEGMIQQLKDSGVNAEILPLHGELSSEEQARCFKRYGRPKCVMSTNVAQTSVTIPDIDAVVDSGMERRIELSNGVEGLYLKPISYADSKQRKGRGGRCKPGIYIDHCRESDRLEFPQAEILRSLLDQTVLRLAEQGFDAEALEFFHQPDIEAIRKAKASLKLIGCMNEDEHVTSIGHLVAKLPVGVKYGRMLVEARELGVLSDVLTIVAILEIGGITDRSNGAWRYLCQGQHQSDLLAQLSIYNQCYHQDKHWMKKNGIHQKALMKARESRAMIVDKMPNTKLTSTGNAKHIIRSICAGFIEHVFAYHFGHYTAMSMKPISAFEFPDCRSLNRDSIVSFPKMLVGIPFDIQTARGSLKLVTMATAIDIDVLKEVAPQLLRESFGHNPRYDHSQECVMSETLVHFGEGVLSRTTVPDPSHPDAGSIIAEATRPAEERYPSTSYLFKGNNPLAERFNPNPYAHARRTSLIRPPYPITRMSDTSRRALWSKEKLTDEINQPPVVGIATQTPAPAIEAAKPAVLKAPPPSKVVKSFAEL